jgi:hypothetical protein
MTLLAQSIYNTLAFFDAQDLPLTLVEIKTYLVASPSLREISLPEVQKVLAEALIGKIEQQNGFYFLSGRKELVALRQKRYRVSLAMLRKCRKYLWALRFFPYLRAVAISGSLALLNSDENSDIDLFLITKKNRIWVSRFLVSLYFQILGQRRYERHIKGRFCLNHYLSEDSEIRQDKNLYTAVEYASLLPVLGKEELIKFWRKNSWLQQFLRRPLPESRAIFFGLQFGFWRIFFEFILEYSIGPLINWVSGRYQKKRIKMQEYVLVSDCELSFHPDSRGQKVLARYQEKLV